MSSVANCGSNNSKLVRVQNFIDGAFCNPADDRYLDSYDPSTGSVWAKVPDSGTSDAERAVQAAKAAFERYRSLLLLLQIIIIIIIMGHVLFRFGYTGRINAFFIGSVSVLSCVKNNVHGAGMGNDRT